MNVLVLGGTQFVGRAIVDELLDKGHSVSLFHRGRTGPDLFPQCEHILGDRTDDVAKVTERTWDAVIDVSAYTPKQATAATQIKTNRYVFISTISVYDLVGIQAPVSESTPLLVAQEGDEVTPSSYGPLKVRCEEILAEHFGDRLTVVRPGIIFGPNDPTGRFPYWVSRLDGCDRILVPDQLGQPVQWIDSRDLAAFAVKMAESNTPGIYNATGPRATFGEMLDAIKAQLNHEHHFVLATLDELEKLDVKIWTDLPLVFKSDDRWSTFNCDPAKALSAGLQLRSLEDTVRATLMWTRNYPVEARGKLGMDRDREVQAMDQLQKA